MSKVSLYSEFCQLIQYGLFYLNVLFGHIICGLVSLYQ